MNEENSLPAIGVVPAPADNLHAELRNLIAGSVMRAYTLAQRKLPRRVRKKSDDFQQTKQGT